MTSVFFSVFYGVDGLTSIAYPYGAFFTSGVYSWEQMDKELKMMLLTFNLASSVVLGFPPHRFPIFSCNQRFKI